MINKTEVKFEVELLSVQFDRVILKVTKPDKEIDYIILDKGSTLNLVLPIEVSMEQSDD